MSVAVLATLSPPIAMSVPVETPWHDLPAYEYLLSGGEDVLLDEFELSKRPFTLAEKSIVAEVYRYTGNEPASWSIARKMKVDLEANDERSPREEFLLHWAAFRSLDERSMTVDFAKSISDKLHTCAERGASGFTVWIEGCAVSAYIFQHVMNTQGQFPDAYVQRANELASAASSMEGEGHFRLFVEGDLRKSVGDFDGGVPLLKKAMAKMPSHALTRSSMGAFVNGRVLAFHEEADLFWQEVIWREGMEQNPGIASFAVNWAMSMSTLNRNAEALKVLSSMVAKESEAAEQTNYSRLLTTYGVVLWNANRLHDAEAQFRLGLKAWPGNIDCCHQLGAVLLAGGRGEEALNVATKSLKLEPGNPLLQIDVARGLAMTGQSRKARTEFARIRRQNPNCADAYYYDLKQRAKTGSKSKVNRKLLEAYAAAVPGDTRLAEIAQLYGVR